MNYRHAFHAGNFADVLKHAVLAHILMYLREKAAAFRVIDSHAGAGLYDLTSSEATRGAEWPQGIGRLFEATLPPNVTELLAPYLDAVRKLNPSGKLRTYPGSPAVVQALLRRQDRLLACELEPHAAAALRRNLRSDKRAKAIEIDGWTGLSAYIPPVERRGLVLIDPAFEQKGDFVRLAQSVEMAQRKWPTGIYMLWYPIKGRPDPDALAKRIKRRDIPKILCAELTVSPLSDPTRLNGCGLIILNPPWTLSSDLAALLPFLTGLLGRDGKGTCRLDWLAGEKFEVR